MRPRIDRFIEETKTGMARNACMTLLQVKQSLGARVKVRACATNLRIWLENRRNNELERAGDELLLLLRPAPVAAFHRLEYFVEGGRPAFFE